MIENFTAIRYNIVIVKDSIAKENRMKKLLIFAVAAMLVFSQTACQKTVNILGACTFPEESEEIKCRCILTALKKEPVMPIISRLSSQVPLT